MTRIESEIVDLQQGAEGLFKFLGNCDNFGTLMPPQITNWKSTVDDCSFTINGMADIRLHISERVPSSKIHFVPEGKAPIDFTLDILITSTGANSAKGQIAIDADLNPFLKMMAEGPLRNFVNLLAQKMKDIPKQS